MKVVSVLVIFALLIMSSGGETKVDGECTGAHSCLVKCSKANCSGSCMLDCARGNCLGFHKRDPLRNIHCQLGCWMNMFSKVGNDQEAKWCVEVCRSLCDYS